MATNAVNIGTGNASGMFFASTAGTVLPTNLSTLTGWAEVGYISDAGMELALNKTRTDIKDWSQTVRRIVLTEHDETASGVCISATSASLSELFGSSNVTASTASITVNLSDNELPPERAYLFVVKDGDDYVAFGCQKGQLLVNGSITFAPDQPISFPFEIGALGSTGMQLIKDIG